MLIGYILYRENQSGWYFDDNTPKGVLCSRCKCCLEDNYISPNVKLDTYVYDIVGTYDARSIINQKFRDFLIRNEYKECECILVNKRMNRYLLRTNQILEFDTNRGGEVGEYCEVCNQYEERVIGAWMFFKNISSPLIRGFYRSDLLFGSYERMHPLMIVGIETFNELRREKLTGMYIEPIFSTEEEEERWAQESITEWIRKNKYKRGSDIL